MAVTYANILQLITKKLSNRNFVIQITLLLWIIVVFAWNIDDNIVLVFDKVFGGCLVL